MTTTELITHLIYKTNTDLPLIRKELGLLLHSGQYPLTQILEVDKLLYQCFTSRPHPSSIIYVKIALSLATTYNNNVSEIGKNLYYLLKSGQTELEYALGVGQVFHYWLGSPALSPAQKCGFFAKQHEIEEVIASDQQNQVMP